MSRGSIWDIEAVMDYIQSNSLFLHFDSERGIDLWTPQHKVPLPLRRSIVKHRTQLHALMLACDARVCPSPRLHRRYWRRSGRGRGPKICTMCRQLDENREIGAQSA